MFSQETETVLQKSLGELPLMVSSRSLRYDIDELVAISLAPSRIAVVDDANTAHAFGDQVFKALNNRFPATRITLESGAVADTITADDIELRASGCDAYVAVGSGTINDLCKHVSHRDGKPYVVFPTAASMNGYVSANASISDRGFKQTLSAHMPRGVFCDLSVIAAAPARLSRSGLGDSVARATAQADWLLSRLLIGTEYKEEVFALLTPYEPQLFEHARGIGKGDGESIGLLMQCLLLSGFGMVIAGGSYPASQGEHMIAHTYDMLTQHQQTPDTLHGEAIGVTTLAMARHQAALLRKPPTLAGWEFPMDAMNKHFDKPVAQECKAAFYKKRERMEAAGISDDNLRSRWDGIAGQLEKVMLPPARIEAILKAAGAPAYPQQLHWDEAIYQRACEFARFTRDRFTFLDMK